jgi:tetratricopeptide (TPR) repeat protein
MYDTERSAFDKKVAAAACLAADDAEFQHQEGERLRRQGRLPEAVAAQRTALRLRPDYAQAHMDLSVALLEQGQLPEAEEAAREALRLRPEYAHAQCNLGNVLARRGKLAEAETAFREALRLKPDLAVAYCNLGAMLCDRAHDYAGALAAFREALRLKPTEAAYHYNVGNVLSKQGKTAEAEAAYRKALRLKPDLAVAHCSLGALLCDRGGDDEAASAAFRQALRLKPDEATYHYNLGMTLAIQGKPVEAEAAFREALHLKPDYAAVYNHLGDSLADRRQLDEAVAAFLESMRLRPDSARPYFNLTRLATQGLYHFSDADIDRLRNLVARPGLPEHDRTLLAFALGDLLDHQGAYDEAFAHYRQGNEGRRQTLLREGRAFDAGQYRAGIDELIAVFDRAFFKHVRGWGLRTELPVFIVGMPRSGTTLVEQILASHPQVYGAGELPHIPQLVRDLFRAMGAAEPYPTCAARLTPAIAAALAEQYVARLARPGAAALRVTDKLPHNHVHLGLIAALFPRVHIIHCCRDPRDIGISCYCNYFGRIPFAYSLEDIGAHYRQYQRIMDHWRHVLPVRLHEVQYEDLVQDQETVSRQLLAFCGLEWDPRCLEFHANRRMVQTVSKFQVRRPMYAHAVGRWKRYQAHLGPLFETLGLPTRTDDREGTPGAS